MYFMLTLDFVSQYIRVTLLTTKFTVQYMAIVFGIFPNIISCNPNFSCYV